MQKKTNNTETDHLLNHTMINITSRPLIPDSTSLLVLTETSISFPISRPTAYFVTDHLMQFSDTYRGAVCLSAIEDFVQSLSNHTVLCWDTRVH